MNILKVAVSSASFSRSPELVNKLSSLPVAASLNAEGKKFTEDDLIHFIHESNAEVVIVGVEPFSKRVIENCPSVRMVCKYGVGLDSLDMKAMTDHGIRLGWTPGVNKRSVSELVLSYCLGHFRNVFPSIHKMQEGTWIKNGGRLFSGLTVGIVGFGHIGADLAQLLQPFGCHILSCDILDKREDLKNVQGKQVDFDELLASSDMISFHVPLTEKTRMMYNASSISRTKDGALVCNTARGNIVDFDAVCQAVVGSKLGGFAADVFPEEPFEASSYAHPHLYFTPHIGGNAKESVWAMGMSAIQHLMDYEKVSR